MLFRTFLGASTMVGILAAGSAVPGSPAASSEPEPRESAAALLDAREYALAERITRRAGFTGSAYTRPERDTGFTTISHWAGEPLAVWWRGTVPADVLALVEEARRHFPVEIRPAARSRVELKEATRNLGTRAGWGRRAPELDRANVRIQSISYPEDGAGIGIRYSRLDDRLPQPLRASVVALVQAISGLPVLAAENGRLASVSRGQATSPWSSGMHIHHAIASLQCTVGFAVTRDMTPLDATDPRQQALLTAGHCIPTDASGSEPFPKFPWYNGAAGSKRLVVCDAPVQDGTPRGVQVKRGLDSALLRVDWPTSATYYGKPCDTGDVDDKYYGGTWYAAAPKMYDVVGAAWTVRVGERIRTSGSVSGELTQEVTDLTAEWSCDDVRYTDPRLGRLTPGYHVPDLCEGVEARRPLVDRNGDGRRREDPPNTIATAEGDSGGPVVKLRTGGPAAVVGLGVISAGSANAVGDGDVSCDQDRRRGLVGREVRGPSDAANHTCARFVYYVDLPRLLCAWDARLKKVAAAPCGAARPDSRRATPRR